MKILCQNFSNALYFIFEGWRQVFIHTGHEWRWMQAGEAPIDVFNEYEPDIYIGTTYDIDRATFKAIAARPNLKVVLKGSNYGPQTDEIDLVKFPIVNANEKELETMKRLKGETGRPDTVFNFYHINRYPGTMEYWKSKLGIDLVEGLPAADIFNYKPVAPRPELQCDIAFVGGYWPYKGINLQKYIFPLCYPIGKYNVKIFGNQPWPLPQYLGNANTDTVEALFSSATICPNISEPHANEFGFEVNERVFKLAANKAFCINDPIASLNEDIFLDNELVIAQDPTHFQDLVSLFIKNPGLRQKHIDACYRNVMDNHTYINRMVNLLNVLKLEDEATKIVSTLKNLVEGENNAG